MANPYLPAYLLLLLIQVVYWGVPSCFPRSLEPEYGVVRIVYFLVVCIGCTDAYTCLIGDPEIIRQRHHHWLFYVMISRSVISLHRYVPFGGGVTDMVICWLCLTSEILVWNVLYIFWVCFQDRET